MAKTPVKNNKRKLKSLVITIMTISDSRTGENDTSGDTLVKLLHEVGHRLYEKQIVADDIYPA